MTLAEFKAWFEGFTEDMDGAPNEKQFEKIKAKVKEITGTPITQTVIREYYERHRPWLGYPYVSYGAAGHIGGAGMTAISAAGQNSHGGTGVYKDIDATIALHDLGMAEYKAMLS